MGVSLGSFIPTFSYGISGSFRADAVLNLKLSVVWNKHGLDGNVFHFSGYCSCGLLWSETAAFQQDAFSSTVVSTAKVFFFFHGRVGR